MLWTYNDNGYLVAADLPERGRCVMCGAGYKRKIQDRRPWQKDMPDTCPRCGHVQGAITGIAFDNVLLQEGAC